MLTFIDFYCKKLINYRCYIDSYQYYFSIFYIKVLIQYNKYPTIA